MRKVLPECFVSVDFDGSYEYGRVLPGELHATSCDDGFYCPVRILAKSPLLPMSKIVNIIPNTSNTTQLSR